MSLHLGCLCCKASIDYKSRAQQSAEMSEAYKLKTIDFLGRRVPIVVQNANGPCPMLALANVLLLRNQIQLSPDAPEVTQVYQPAYSAV